MNKVCDKCGQVLEVNADGDTREDMKAVYERFGGLSCRKASIQGQFGSSLHWSDHRNWEFDPEKPFPVEKMRITAKHADKFCKESMDWETWARAAIDRGMVVRGEGRMTTHKDKTTSQDDCVLWATRIYKGELIGPDSRGSAGHYWALSYGQQDWAWTAITREQYEEETKPKEPAVVPWNAETFPKDRPVWIKQKTASENAPLHMIWDIAYSGVKFERGGGLFQTWEQLVAYYIQHDGSPCGTMQ